MKTMLYLTPQDHGRPLTVEELQSADAQEGFRYEVIHGRLEVSPLPGRPHDELQAWLVQKLKDYAKQRPDAINNVMGPARVFLPEQDEMTAPEPDVAAYHGYPLDLPLRERHWQDHSPVLVVEVISEDSAEKDLTRNRDLYIQVPSIREYWIIDPRPNPDEPALLVYRRRGQRWQRPIHVPFRGTYTTRLLPDFSLTVDPHT
jgi:Uma2 family endonuclease